MIEHHYPCDLCGRPSGDDAPACTLCAHQAATALNDIAEWLGDALVEAMAKQTVLGEVSGGKPTKKAEQPLPVDLRASEALAVLRSTLSTWVRLLQDDGATSHPRANTVRSMAAWLAPVTQWARTREYGAEVIDEVIAAHHQAFRAVDRPPELAYAGRCPTCTAPIYALGDRQTARCRTPGCDGHVAGVTAARLDLLRRTPGQLVTATDAARALTTAGHPVTDRWIRHLAQTGRILQIGGTRPARYRIGDIMDVIAPQEVAAS